MKRPTPPVLLTSLPLFFDANPRYDCSNPFPCDALGRGPLYRERQRVLVIPNQCPPRNRPLQVLAHPPLLHRVGSDGRPRLRICQTAHLSAYAAHGVSIHHYYPANRRIKHLRLDWVPFSASSFRTAPPPVSKGTTRVVDSGLRSSLAAGLFLALCGSTCQVRAPINKVSSVRLTRISKISCQKFLDRRTV